ncbi:alpha/beta fold hydrolase [Novosphingobium sp. G106]|uniref:RBBP9/YdeN family alpha/beta hydrolase n=1 Tax=Novosphingobium sp. G106 TaxID=2849500 RepID=UPI001C2CC62C|nr:alpha/beta fold hydrolase [Novosphingobium sp. G106]MBV1687470.1 alpha/beta fold hydrolase [Novosphingobium sp. G106]
MAYHVENTRKHDDQEPLILLIPGLNDSGPDHWQTHWERKRANVHRVELGMWDDPHRNTWVNKLNLAIHRADRPVVLVAHSLGCMTVAWWAEYERPGPDTNVIGALLVAPPDVDRPGLDPRLSRFSACPRSELPFPSVVVASQDDSYCSQRSAISLARDWGSRFADAGAVGHINADSALGDWPLGERLLEQLMRGHGPLPREIPVGNFVPARAEFPMATARRH